MWAGGDIVKRELHPSHCVCWLALQISLSTSEIKSAAWWGPLSGPAALSPPWEEAPGLLQGCEPRWVKQRALAALRAEHKVSISRANKSPSVHTTWTPCWYGARRRLRAPGESCQPGARNPTCGYVLTALPPYLQQPCEVELVQSFTKPIFNNALCL